MQCPITLCVIGHYICSVSQHPKPYTRIYQKLHFRASAHRGFASHFCKSANLLCGCRFTIHFDTFCPDTKNDTGLPPMYMMVLSLLAIVPNSILGLPSTKTNAFVQKTSKCMTRSDHGTSLLHRRHSRGRNTLVPYKQVFGPQCCA